MTWPGRRWIAEAVSLLFSLLVLAAGGFYTYVGIFSVPHSGFVLSSRWVVTSLDTCANPALPCELSPNPPRIGDQIVRIGTLTYEQFRQDFSATPFAGFAPDDVVPLQLLRDGQLLETTWRMPQPAPIAYWLRAAPILTFLPFWLAGTLVLMVMRPRNQLWLSLITTNYALALWTVTGANSASQQAYGTTYVYIITSWIMPPVYMRLHHVLLGLRSRWSRISQSIVNAICLLLLGLSLLQMIGPGWSAFAVGTAALAGLALLISRQRAGPPAARQVARLMIVSNLLAFGPGIVVMTFTIFANSSAETVPVVAIALLALAIWPIGYVYAAYRTTLGALEFRANRLITQYSYAILASTLVGVAALGLPHGVSRPLEVLISTGTLAGLTLVLIWAYQPFRTWMDRLTYGIVYTSDDILRVMARQLPVVSDEPRLIRLLADELLPSLLVRQSALYRLGGDLPELVYERGAPAGGALPPERLRVYLDHLWQYRPATEGQDWVRLAVPLDVQNRRLGLWLFGLRDPDDFYAAQDIHLLRLLANQIAVALENVRLYKTVRGQAEEMEQLYQKEKEVSQLKSEFLARTSHELRTPLTGILGSLGLVLEAPDLPLSDQRRFMETAHRSASSLLRLVNDLLDMAQIEAGRLTTRLWAVDMLLVAREVYAEFEAPARLKGLDFQLTSPPEVTNLAWADPDRARQILRNLVDNAIKFTPAGRVHIRLDTDAPAGQFHAVVEDSGIGVPAEKQAQLFQPFVQADGSFTRAYGGTGLGLAISRRLAELMSGSLVLYSEGDGQGCTLTLTLRAAPDDDNEYAAAADAELGR